MVFVRAIISFIFCRVMRSESSTSSEWVISCWRRRYSVKTLRRKLAVLWVPGVAYIVRRNGRVEDIVESGGRTLGDEVGETGGDFCGERPRRRSRDDIPNKPLYQLGQRITA